MGKKSFWSIIKDYQIIQILLIGIGIFYCRDYIFEYLCSTMDLVESTQAYKFYFYLIYLGLPASWLYFFYVHIRDKRYHDLTERNYQRDHSQFRKTYSALVKFFSTNDPYKLDPSDLPVADWHTSDGVILGKYKDRNGVYHLIKRDSDANGNLVAFGLPGSGKSTTQAATTAARFNSDLPTGGCGVFAISIKGDLLNFAKEIGTRKNIKVFTPDNAIGSCHYNPLQGVEEMSWTERRIFAENISIIICPEETGDNSRFFYEGARNYLTAIILYLLYLHDSGKRKGNLKFPEIIDLILQSSVFNLTLRIKNCPNTIPGEYTNSFVGSSEKNVSGIWSHLCKCIRPFNCGAIRTLFDGQGDCISPDDLDHNDIYIDVPQDKYDVYAPAMAIIITNFLQAFMRRDDVSSGKKITPILFLLDEAVQLNLDYNILSKAMSTLRSKKVSLFLLMQSVAQLEGRYGEAHAREIIDLCAYISVFNAQDPRSREFFQKLVGRKKMLKRSTSTSKKSPSGISVNEMDEYIFEAADFGCLNIKDKKTQKTTYRVLVYANGKYILAETTPCYL